MPLVTQKKGWLPIYIRFSYHSVHVCRADAETEKINNNTAMSTASQNIVTTVRFSSVYCNRVRGFTCCTQLIYVPEKIQRKLTIFRHKYRISTKEPSIFFFH